MNVNFDILNELIEACEDWGGGVGRGAEFRVLHYSSFF